VLEWFGLRIPYEWSHSPFERAAGTGVHGIMNVPSVLILLVLTLLLIRGTKESALVNGLIVVLKTCIVLLVITIGWGFINPANHTPLIPAATTYTTPQGIQHAYGGILGILGAAGVVFFAYIGFDAVSTAAQEAKNPKRDMPIGILGSLVICTVLYVLFAYVLSGVATVEDFRTAGREASVAFAITKYMPGYEWLSKSVTVAISDVHRKFRTPYKSNLLFFLFTGLIAAFVPADVTGEMTSIGTLFAFILVCAGVWIMRRRRPDIERGFRVPALPVIATLGIIVCGAMIYGLGWTNWMRLIVWLLIGLVFYFGYGKNHSLLNAPPPKLPEGTKLGG
jgi:APA family basic amino acid/polyamine antiporter